MVDRAPNASVVATTLREVSSAHVNDWSSAAWSTETGFVAGPRMMACTSWTVSAHGALVMTTPGDVSMASLAEVEALIANGSAHVRR